MSDQANELFGACLQKQRDGRLGALPDESFDHFLERVFIERMAQDPEAMTWMGIAELHGVRDHNRRLTDHSPAAEQAAAALNHQHRQQLAAYDFEALTDSQRISAEILAWSLDHDIQGEHFRFHDYPVNQMTGVHLAYPDLLLSHHPLNHEEDHDALLERLKGCGDKFAGLLEALQLRDALGVRPPAFVLERVLDDCRRFAEADADKHLLTGALAHRMAVTGLAETTIGNLLNAARTLIRENVAPAYAELAAWVSEVLPRCGGDDGVWSLPEGEAYYRHVLRGQTTTEMTPEEIHQRGLDEVARVQEEMRRIMKKAGFEATSPMAFLAERAVDPACRFRADQGEDCLQLYRSIIAEAEAAVKGCIRDYPGVGPVEVWPVPEYKEPGAPAAYYDMPNVDGSRPGIFYLNMRNVQEINRFGMRTLACHEAVPGHHLQLSIQLNNPAIPSFRKISDYNAYIEGWALYAEVLGREIGVISEPLDLLGSLQSELFRAVRLVVDTGIHAKRWDRARAMDYMIAQTGMPENEIRTEVDRYVVMPGQACSYAVGLLEIMRLREMARSQLGAGFDLKTFHHWILDPGAMPLEVLAREVERGCRTSAGQ